MRGLGDLVFWLKMVRIEPVWDGVKTNMLTNEMRAARLLPTETLGMQCSQHFELGLWDIFKQKQQALVPTSSHKELAWKPFIDSHVNDNILMLLKENTNL